jgi:tetratricopeptide (TPR) repeat protein
LRRQAGSGSEIARSLNNLAAVAFARNDFDRACQLFAESLSLYRDAGDRWGAAGALLGLAVANHRQGDAPHAVALLEESLSLYGEVGDRRSAALAALNLADALRDSDELAQARDHYRDALIEFSAVDDRARVTVGLLGLGSLLVRAGEFERAATLFGAASTLKSNEEPGSGEASPEIATPAADLDAIRGALGKESFTAAWEAGRTLSLEAAMQEALGSAIPLLP